MSWEDWFYDYNLSCESDNEDLGNFSSFILQLMYLFYCFICYGIHFTIKRKYPRSCKWESENPDSEELENNVFIDEPPYGTSYRNINSAT